MKTNLNRRPKCFLIAATLQTVLFASHLLAAETLLSGFEGDFSTTLDPNAPWADTDAISTTFVTGAANGVTQGSQALKVGHIPFQTIPLKLRTLPVEDIQPTFNAHTQLRADFTVPTDSQSREVFFRLQLNGGSTTIDGDDMIIVDTTFLPDVEPGETITGIWDYAAEGIFAQVAAAEPLSEFWLEIGMRGDQANPPPEAFTTVDNIRWCDAEQGDLDCDGDVDGSDFLYWQRGGFVFSNNLFDPGQRAALADWEGNYPSSPLSAVAAVVPEPASLLLLSVGFITLANRRRSPESF